MMPSNVNWHAHQPHSAMHAFKHKTVSGTTLVWVDLWTKQHRNGPELVQIAQDIAGERAGTTTPAWHGLGQAQVVNMSKTLAVWHMA
tara:strand:+ start:323 stop:583 length:261 start_codon:yes stop_codon:yes gene_type:complete